jgi:hypothetical protein
MISIGWVALDESGSVRHSPPSVRWYEREKRQNRKGPIKVYQTEGRAKAVSPTKQAREVFHK